jgi:undecaprenyl diphosphate synthase
MKDMEHSGPNHVAIIMDGNGRWATSRGKPRLFGHHAGAKRVREVVNACPDLGVKYVTIFAFSTENWKRTQSEVSGLMSLYCERGQGAFQRGSAGSLYW